MVIRRLAVWSSPEPKVLVPSTKLEHISDLEKKGLSGGLTASEFKDIREFYALVDQFDDNPYAIPAISPHTNKRSNAAPPHKFVDLNYAQSNFDPRKDP